MKAAQLYQLNHASVTNTIAELGHEVTFLVQGHIGSGKSSILKELAKRFPNHVACYFDCTTKDLGDITVPKLKELGTHDFVRFAPNEEFGLHLGKPLLLMIDEYGKANPAVKNGLLRTMQERMVGNTPLPEGSIVFATTNLGSEGVGDLLMPHARNRITMLTMRKPNAQEWIEWGLDNDVDPIILGWVRDNPHCLNSFEDHENPDENPYIYHPRAARTSFVTHRSLERASRITKRRDKIGTEATTAALMGTIGERAAMDMGAFVTLADQLPSLESIRKTPDIAAVPKTAPGVCMVVLRVLQTIESSWTTQWFQYMDRLPNEAKALFVNSVRSRGYNETKRGAVMNSAAFTQYIYANGHLFGADQ